MAIIRKSDLKHITKSQIEDRLSEIRKELMKFNAQRAVGTAIENPGKVKELRRTVAKLLTIKNRKDTDKGVTKEVKAKV